MILLYFEFLHCQIMPELCFWVFMVNSTCLVHGVILESDHDLPGGGTNSLVTVFVFVYEFHNLIVLFIFCTCIFIVLISSL